MKVKVIKVKYGSYWYANEIGNTFCVEKLSSDLHPQFTFKVVGRPDGNKFFDKDDVEIITDVYVKHPTIGEKYVANHSGEDQWYECVVLYNHPENKEAYACMRVGKNTLFWSSDFKVVKSPEQKQLDIVMQQIQQLQKEAEKLQQVVTGG